MPKCNISLKPFKSFTVQAKPPLSILPKTSALIEQVESRLAEQGRVLVRYSGTQQMARVMVEGQDSREVERLVEEISEQMLTEINELSR